MLPETCTIDDVYSCAGDAGADADSTLTKRRSFGDQYMLFVRQNTRDYMENNFPPGRETVRDLVIVQDECMPPLRELLLRIDYERLTTLFIVDCRLQLDDDCAACFGELNLTTLVLSHTHLRRLPVAIFELISLEVLKVDRNSLEEIPADIGRLQNLKSFCCDTQRPRLRTLPHTMTSLERLQSLSFCDNRIDCIAWVGALSGLRVLRCARNRITRLPTQLSTLADLTTLDVSHNRLEYIPACFAGLVRRLFRFDYYNVTLRPRSVRCDATQLLTHLELESFLSQTPGGARDISVGVVGESHSGKSSLVDALRADRGVCRSDIARESPSSFEIQQFDIRYDGDDGDATSTSTMTSPTPTRRYMSTIVFANDVLDDYTRNVQVDLYLLVVDLTSFELKNGSQHLFARHVARMRMWLRALYEIAPDTPVLVVGTHAELVKSMSYSDLWCLLQDVLEEGRAHHAHRYADSRLCHCLLCAPKSRCVRQVVAKSRSGSAGFVDLTFPHGQPMMNGHVSTGQPPPAGHLRCPHIVGFYEIDSHRNLPKDAKRSNVSVEQLKSAILRLTSDASDSGIPGQWLSFVRHVATINERAPQLPCIPYDEIVSISRSFDIAPADVPLMLHYFHRRGKLVHFHDDGGVLSRLVVVNPTWFIGEIGRLLDSLDASTVAGSELLGCLHHRDIDRQLQKAGGGVASAQWLLSALQSLDLCVPYPGPGVERRFLLPDLLETGHPSHDVWPDVPEWDEKQITCDFRVRAPRARFFIDLVLHVIRDGRRQLDIVDEPAPVFLSHHIVFYTATDVGGCEDCYVVRRRVRRRAGSPASDAQDDVMHKVHVQLHARMDTLRVAVRGLTPCCTMKTVLSFIELYLDDIPEDEFAPPPPLGGVPGVADRASVSSHALSCSGSGSGSLSASPTVSSDRGSVTSSENDDDERQLFLLCPKCVLMRHANPERICYHTMSPRRRAICSRWHNLGSWSRVVTGDYRIYDHVSSHCLSLPEYEHPRLVLILPPSSAVSTRDWYMSCRLRFLEGFEAHFLCEYTGYWHFADGCGFRLNQSAAFVRRVGDQMGSLIALALAMVQVINGVPDHALNGRMLAPVIAELVKNYDYLSAVDKHLSDPYAWLIKNKDRVVTMLTKVLANCSDGYPDLYFKIGNALDADAVFHAPSSANRYDLARFLRIRTSPGRFGPLRPLFIGKDIRWLCDAHYEELRNMPST